MADVLGTLSVMGVLPREELAYSVGPFSDAARAMSILDAKISITLAVFLSSIGALNGWTPLMGQVRMAAARGGLLGIPVFVWQRRRSSADVV
ncbi:hypothetical protein SAZ10_04490 [Mesorhizobium sp. BAC0120]|nr:hypothetical protein [Mesorhizobium sp. BAC0120]MDW6021017.1 hypothetical protein [Mesorhizobium sp. BAC0120]